MHSLVKPVSRAAVEKRTQTCETNPDDDAESLGQPRMSETAQGAQRMAKTQGSGLEAPGGQFANCNGAE